MNITQQDRHDLFAKLQSALGESGASTLMELLPLQPNAELATRADMASLRDTVRGELAEVRGEIAEVRGEISELRGELKGDMASLRSELKGDMASLQSELKGDMASLDGRLTTEMGRLDGRLTREMGRLYRWGAAVVAANAVSTITVILAA